MGRGSTACATCNADCGNGTATVRSRLASDPIYVAMCRILCETRKEMCEGRHRGRTASQVAEQKARNSPDLQRAINRRYPGATSAVNQHRYVRFDNADPSWGRTPVSRDVINRHLDNVLAQIRRQAARTAATKVGRAAARSWMKLVPILNVVSTAYDVYDLASTGVDVYNQIQQARAQFSGNVYSIRPDVAVMGQNGQLQDIYDFKFDGDGWAPGQQQMYNQDLQNSGSSQTAKSVNSEDCGCDGPRTVPRTG
jgi:hypothetical protein